MGPRHLWVKVEAGADGTGYCGVPRAMSIPFLICSSVILGIQSRQQPAGKRKEYRDAQDEDRIRRQPDPRGRPALEQPREALRLECATDHSHGLLRETWRGSAGGHESAAEGSKRTLSFAAAFII